MRCSFASALLLMMLLPAGCRSTANRSTSCSRSPAPWSTVAAELNRYANCNRPAPNCPGRILSATSSAYVVWQGSCTATFTIAAQDAILANATQQLAASPAPLCPATGKPMSIARWEYFDDAIVGTGSSCVVRVQVHYECCGGENPD